MKHAKIPVMVATASKPKAGRPRKFSGKTVRLNYQVPVETAERLRGLIDFEEVRTLTDALDLVVEAGLQASESPANHRK